MAFSPSQISTSTSFGKSSAAARRSLLLCESLRRLPEMPRTFIYLLLRERQLGVDRDPVGESLLATGKRGVPGDAVAGAVHLGLEREADALCAVVLGGLADRAAAGDGQRDALDGQVACNGDLLPGYAHGSGVERDLRRALGVEEVGRLKMPVQVLVLHLHAGRGNGAAEVDAAVLRPHQLAGHGRTAAAECAGDVIDREAGVRMDWIEVPGPGGDGASSG